MRLAYALLAVSAFAQTPDTILISGKIITGDGRDSVAEAVSIKDGKVLSVGAKSVIQKSAGPTTKIIDLRGRTATPGLIDSHLHFNNGVESLYAIDLSEMRSIKEVQQAVRERAAKMKPGEWIRGNGWEIGRA